MVAYGDAPCVDGQKAQSASHEDADGNRRIEHAEEEGVDAYRDHHVVSRVLVAHHVSHVANGEEVFAAEEVRYPEFALGLAYPELIDGEGVVASLEGHVQLLFNLGELFFGEGAYGIPVGVFRVGAIDERIGIEAREEAFQYA